MLSHTRRLTLAVAALTIVVGALGEPAVAGGHTGPKKPKAEIRLDADHLTSSASTATRLCWR